MDIYVYCLLIKTTLVCARGLARAGLECYRGQRVYLSYLGYGVKGDAVITVHNGTRCQPSRFHRESPEIFSISRLPPGLHICNSISRDCYLSLHTCIDKTPSFCKALVGACSKVQLEARHYNTSWERIHIIT